MLAHWLVQGLADVAPDEDWMAPGERETCAGFRSAKRSSDWRVGRWTAKQALTRLSAGDAAVRDSLTEIVVGTKGNGAACCAIHGSPVPWSISISHSHGRGLCVIAPRGVMVGCDLERVEPRIAAFSREWFTCAEQNEIARASPDERDLLVTLFWSAKESALKALGVGLTISTHAVTVSADPRESHHEWHALHVHRVGHPGDMYGWWRQDGHDLLTVVTAPALPPPVSLNRGVRPALA